MRDTGFRLLTVDLSSGEKFYSTVEPEDHRAYLGGSGLGAKLLFMELKPTLDPLSPQAPLLLMTGPMTGTGGPAGGRFTICGRSPATGLWAESNCGGFFGPELRKAGIDGLKIVGKASEPVYMNIRDDEVNIRSAGHLWGSHNTYETRDAIRDELEEKKTRVACIGLAGETKIRFASILCDHGRMAGRTGMGAVMGSKNLKAIAVHGTKPIPIANEERYGPLRRKANIDLRNDMLTLAFREVGTASATEYWEYLGMMPKKYFSAGVFEGAGKISGSQMVDTILSGYRACHACVIACGRRVRLSDGVERKGPEYETIMGFGPNLGIDDLEAVTMMGEWCDRYGMDTISVSNTIGLAFLLFERGLLSEDDTGGLNLRWGNVEAGMQLVHQIAKREGLGEQLAQGAKSFASQYGAPEAAAQVGDLEVPYQDPRGSSGMALVYTTSPRGACHNQGDYYMVETGMSIDDLGVDFLNRRAGVEKVAHVARHQDWTTVRNSLGMCIFANVESKMIVELLNEVTGWDHSIDSLMEIGARAWNLKRAINIRLGLVPEESRLPKHLMIELEDGGAAGYVPPLDEMLEAYYEFRDWDDETGRPSRDRLRKLGLDWVIPEIWET
jgi:aldehyde:ferredoxin oxidoreductase